MRIKVVITYEPDKNAYLIEAPELAGCTSQGKTIDKALTNIRDVIKNWIDIEKKQGRLDIQEELDMHEEKEVFTGEISV